MANGKRIALAAATAFIAVNIWTGAPLLALWIGSHAVGQTTLSMPAVIIVVGVLAATDLALGVLLVRLNRVYRDLLGLPDGLRRAAWLRSLSGEGDEESGEPAVTLIERIVVICVYAAMIALVVWFLFFAKSPLPG